MRGGWLFLRAFSGDRLLEAPKYLHSCEFDGRREEDIGARKLNYCKTLLLYGSHFGHQREGGSMAKKFVSNKDESARLFKSDFLEFFTHVHWSVPIIIYLPVTVYFLVMAGNTPGLGLQNIILLFDVGFVF